MDVMSRQHSSPVLIDLQHPPTAQHIAPCGRRAEHDDECQAEALLLQARLAADDGQCEVGLKLLEDAQPHLASLAQWQIRLLLFARLRGGQGRAGEREAEAILQHGVEVLHTMERCEPAHPKGV
jgi:hypothetical protein